MNKKISELFASGLQALNLSLDSVSQEKLLHFLLFLKKWNGHYNLTAITELEKMIAYHLLDSLSIAPFITGQSILDVGSGAGFPGIPLAIYFPEKRWTLLDSNGKKARFLIQATAELQLKNVDVIHDRVEKWPSSQKFDVILARAMGSVKDIMAQTRQHLQPGGQWLLMKGDYQHEELETLKPPPLIHTLSIPGITAPRNLIAIHAQSERL